MPVVIAVDSGKHSTKAVKEQRNGNKKQLKFRSRADETNEDMPTVEDNESFVITYQGAKYLVGHEANDNNSSRSKSDIIHKMCVYTATAHLLEEGETEVILAIGCPLDIYKNVEQRKKYKKYYMEEEEINVRINKRDVSFRIVDIIVCPESCGVIYNNYHVFKNKTVGVIDIGGLNTNCAIYKNLFIVRGTGFTTELGGNMMLNDIRKLLRSSFPSVKLSVDCILEEVIERGYLNENKQESAELINKNFKDHAKKILEKCDDNNWDLNEISIVFIGGGSKFLAKEIGSVINSKVMVSENAEWENVLGFLSLGKAYKRDNIDSKAI